MFVFIDSKSLFNVEKMKYMFREDIKLESFKNIRKTIVLDNLISSKLIVSKDTPILIVPGFKNIDILSENKLYQKRGALHPTQQLTLFSMAYATDYLVFKTRNAKLSTTDIEILNKMYLFVYSEISNPISLNNMTVNDHVISERIQFIILYLSYLKDYEQNQKEMIVKLNRDLNICTGFLLNNTHFTWQSNHGVMQLRAIAQLATYTRNPELKSQLIHVFNKRLLDVLPFFIGEDGAIYEAATGYWIFIYTQFEKMAAIEAVKNQQSVVFLKQRILKSRRFLNVITTNDNYIQGLGDSYSKFLNDSLTKNCVPKNRFFTFSNQFAGFNWTTDSINSSILFVSLNTPPNVHKQPDDLGLYIYRNGSFFANTGIYSYKESKERAYIESERSQSTVTFEKSGYVKPKGSYIKDAGLDSNNNRILDGVKYYENLDTIYRRFVFENGNSFKIIDKTNCNKSLRTSFNIVPSVKIKRLSDTSILLENSRNVKMQLSASKHISVSNSYISDSYNHLITIKRLVVPGNEVLVNIRFFKSDSKPISATQFNEIGGSTVCKRLEIAKVLNMKYKSNTNSQFNTISFVIESVVLLLGLLIVSVFVSELICKRYVKIKD